MKTDIKAVGICGIVILESIAMLTGHDGYCFGLAIAAIAGISGYEIGITRNIRR